MGGDRRDSHLATLELAMDVALAAITPRTPSPGFDTAAMAYANVDNDLVVKNLKVISRVSFRRSSNT
jgi:hypothetical protein